MCNTLSIAELSWVEEPHEAKILRDNPILDRLIEVGTKALRRGLMSGETLRAPRQQLRRLRASAFALLFKSPAIARLSGARSVFGLPCKRATTIRSSPPRFFAIQKSVQPIRKNLTSLVMPCVTKRCLAFCLFRETPI